LIAPPLRLHKDNNIMQHRTFTQLLKISIATTCAAALTACGGGGGDSYDPSQPGPGSVTDAQAFKVSSASIAGGPMSMLVPTSIMINLINAIQFSQPSAYTTFQGVDVSSYCTAPGGRMILDALDADNSLSFTNGDAVTLSFTNCAASADGTSLLLNGTLVATQSTVLRGADTVILRTYTPNSLSATVRGIPATYNGALSIEEVRLNGNPNTYTLAYVTNMLEINFAGGQRTDRISNVRWGFLDDIAAGVIRLSPNQNVTLFENGVTTAFSVATVTPITLRNSDNLLTAGQLSVLHPADTLRVLVTGVNQLEIAIDYNSGGLFDRFLNIAALDLLNGWN
jgi:hypothetical protein